MSDLKITTEVGLFSYLGDKTNYKTARKKQYIIWCCQPKVGSIVNGQKIEKGLFVIQDITGDKKVVSFADLKVKYVLVTGEDITKEFITKKKQGKHSIEWFQLKTRIDNVPQWAVYIPKELKFEIPSNSLFLSSKENIEMKYIAILNKDKNEAYVKNKEGNIKSCTLGELLRYFNLFDGRELTEDIIKEYINSDVIKINTEYNGRGKGDFIVCTSDKGRPNVLKKVRVIQGDMFALTYNIRGWKDCVNEGITQDLSIPKSIIAKEDSAEVDDINNEIAENMSELNNADSISRGEESVIENTVVEQVENDSMSNEVINNADEIGSSTENEGTVQEENNVDEDVECSDSAKNRDNDRAENEGNNDIRKIEDFGDKIGGAKKDLWKVRGLALEDLEDMTAAEKIKYVKKENIWPKPNYEELVRKGLDVKVVFFQKVIRDACPAKMIGYEGMDDEVSEDERYITFISTVRELVESMPKVPDVESRLYLLERNDLVSKNSYGGYKVTQKSSGYLTKKLFKAFQISDGEIREGIKSKQFCYSDDAKYLSYFNIYYVGSTVEIDKDRSNRDVLKLKTSAFSTSYFYSTDSIDVNDIKDTSYIVARNGTNELVGINLTSELKAKEYAKKLGEKLEKEAEECRKGRSKDRKKVLTPKMLKDINRVGAEIRDGKDITEQDIQEQFMFKGGEFGNWLNDEERQASLNFSYEAFMDLADILNIDIKSISFNKRLSIAYGARGSGFAAAHYESLREVINLTKMKGAGSLAHEWIHALDDMLGKSVRLNGFMSDNIGNPRVLNSLVELLSVIKTKDGDIEEHKRKCKDEVAKRIDELQKQVMKNVIVDITAEDKEEISTGVNAMVKEIMIYVKNESYLLIYTPEYNTKILKMAEKCSDAFKALLNIFKEKGIKITALSREKIGKAQNELVLAYWALRKANKGETIKVNTDFYNDAIMLDKIYTKLGHGYWASNIELLARAGACYIKDKLEEQGRRNDYLCGHADAIEVPVDCKTYYAAPQGIERKRINAAFDKFFEDLKERGFL